MNSYYAKDFEYSCVSKSFVEGVLDSVFQDKTITVLSPVPNFSRSAIGKKSHNYTIRRKSDRITLYNIDLGTSYQVQIIPAYFTHTFVLNQF